MALKIFLLLPDGVGIRNFVYTDFLEVCPEGVEVTVWTDQLLRHLLREDGNVLPILELPRFQTTPRIEVLRRAKQTAELLRNAQKFDDPVYKTYLAPAKRRTLKALIKWAWEQWFLKGNCNDLGVQKLKDAYLRDIRKTRYYARCKQQLEAHRPDGVFCTHQRASIAIAPLLAAKDLDIPTATFIYSWDNLPKATLVVDATHYLVWSSYMKAEMKKYYPEISAECVHITGTPQFTPYFDLGLEDSREEFCSRYGLAPESTFICYSGDDLTTSPHDPLYLADLARAVRKLNEGVQRPYHVLFRRCPVDWSQRFDEVLQSFSDVVTAIDPLWKSMEGNEAWSYFIPEREDIALLTNLVRHCSLVVNVGSTMAIDFATLGKPACYIRYDAVHDPGWSAEKVYNFIHFRTMDGLDPVYWINGPEDWERVLPLAVRDQPGKVSDARRWQKIIAQHPLNEANHRIWNALLKIATHAHLFPV